MVQFYELDSAQRSHRLWLEIYEKKNSVFGKLICTFPFAFWEKWRRFSLYLGKTHKNGGNKAIFALGIPPITEGGQIKKLTRQRKGSKVAVSQKTLWRGLFPEELLCKCLGSFHRYFVQASVSSWGLALPGMVLISLSDKLSIFSFCIVETGSTACWPVTFCMLHYGIHAFFVHGGLRFSVNRREIQMKFPMIQMVNNDRPVQSVCKFYNTNALVSAISD